ncbi:MAG: hypothetical protein ACXWK3_14645 [Reyranella sp.]
MARLKAYLAMLLTWSAMACATVLAIGVIIVGTVATTDAVASLILPRTVRVYLLERVGLYNEAQALQFASLSNENVEDARSEVFPDLWAIASWITGCTKSTDTRYLVPAEFMTAFYRKQPYYNEPVVNVAPSYGNDGAVVAPDKARPSSAQPSDANSPKVQPRAPSRQELALAQLSYAIAKQRVEARTKAQAAYALWQFSTLTTIIIGLVTTIVVSLSATEFVKNGRIALTVKVLAIVFPVIGTAFAAIIAFYGPQAEWSQSSRTFAALSQLHGQIALDIFKIEDCPPSPTKDSELAKQLETWGKNYKDIETLANAAASGSTGGQAGPSGGNQDGQGNKGQAGNKSGDAPPANAPAPQATR